MTELPRPARIYILLVFGLSLPAVLISLPALSLDAYSSLTVVVVAIVIALLELSPVAIRSNIKNNGVEVTISVAVKFAAIMLLPPQLVILSVFLGTLLAEAWLRRVWYKLIFNVGMMTILYTVLAVLYTSLHDPTVPLLGSPQNIVALVALGVSDVILNGILVSLIVALATETPLTYVWAQNYKPLVLHDLSMLPLGVFIVILWQFSPWSVVLAALPLFVMRHSYQMVENLGLQTREALYALAHVLDERDKLTSHHSEMVAENAGLIAITLGLGPEQVEVIQLAAALHDIGKIGMRNDILFKTGTLTNEERDKAKMHAEIGGDLLKKFPLFEKGAIYVRHHHERWDGTGYPDRLMGEAIPLGARILAVADAFQAMTEERPYRQALAPEAALEELKANAGTQFDPTVVAAFLRAKGVEMPPTPEASLLKAHEPVSVPNNG